MNLIDILNSVNIVFIILFIVPGFFSIKTYQLIFPNDEKTGTEKIIDAIAYSVINYAILFFPIVLVEKYSLYKNCPFLYYIFYVFVLIVAPIILVFVWKKIRLTNFFIKDLPHPTIKPWDYLFGKKQPYWIKVTLKNGHVIAGKYDWSSFASSSPAPEHIYLEETWVLDKNGAFISPKEDTAGVIILPNEISYIELIKLEDN